MVDYRLDYRTKEQFVESIKHFTLKEKRYFLLWINTHNKGRHKKEISYISWGNNSNEIVDNIDDSKIFCRPDFLIIRHFDNSWEGKDISPIEVQTCSILYPDECYIKKSKIDWNFDKTTKDICTKSCHILFIIGTCSKGSERYHLFSPDEIEKIKQNGIKYPECLGKKPCYFFNYSDYKWKSFNNDIFQFSLYDNKWNGY